eukprot:g10560.t1
MTDMRLLVGSEPLMVDDIVSFCFSPARSVELDASVEKTFSSRCNDTSLITVEDIKMPERPDQRRGVWLCRLASCLRRPGCVSRDVLLALAAEASLPNPSDSPSFSMTEAEKKAVFSAGADPIYTVRSSTMSLTASRCVVATIAALAMFLDTHSVPVCPVSTEERPIPGLVFVGEGMDTLLQNSKRCKAGTFVYDGDSGRVLVQSAVIQRYCAKKLNLLPTDPDRAYEAEMTIAEMGSIYDMMYYVFRGFINPDEKESLVSARMTALSHVDRMVGKEE